MRIVPLSLRVANAFIAEYHRHSGLVRGHKFSIGLCDGDRLLGVAVVGRPLARLLDDGSAAEIRRVCVRDGVPNGCSRLYARARQICQLMGYERVFTYSLSSEGGGSLRAVGAVADREVGPHSGWSRQSRPRRSQPVDALAKVRWQLLSQPAPPRGESA